jgi:hypothetical protein
MSIEIALVSHECEDAIGGEKDVAQMLSKAFKAAKGHWMVLDKDPQLKGALNAVLRKMGDEHPDRQRLETEIRLLSQLNAMFSAARTGLSVGLPDFPEDFEAIGVMKLWEAA